MVSELLDRNVWGWCVFPKWGLKGGDSKHNIIVEALLLSLLTIANASICPAAAGDTHTPDEYKRALIFMRPSSGIISA